MSYTVIWEDFGVKSKYNCSWNYAQGVYDSYKNRCTKSVMIVRQSDHTPVCSAASKGRYDQMMGHYHRSVQPKLK